MSKTLVFKTFEEFKARKDKEVNGVSPEFAAMHPNFEADNEYNIGCWNCLDSIYCMDCTMLVSCTDCSSCHDSKRLNACHGCRRSENLRDLIGVIDNELDFLYDMFH